MTEDNRKPQDQQEKKDELTEKDLERASGGQHSVQDGRHVYEGERKK